MKYAKGKLSLLIAASLLINSAVAFSLDAPSTYEDGETVSIKYDLTEESRHDKLTLCTEFYPVFTEKEFDKSQCAHVQNSPSYQEYFELEGKGEIKLKANKFSGNTRKEGTLYIAPFSERGNRLSINTIRYDIDSKLQGEGTSKKPYQINKCSELDLIRYDMDANYEITSDLHCKAVELSPIGKGETPFNDRSFTGRLDGQGFRISDLEINSGKSEKVGLFSEMNYYGISQPGVVENLQIENIEIKTGKNAKYIGAIAGAKGVRGTAKVSKVAIKGLKITNRGENTVIGGVIGEDREGSTREISVQNIEIVSEGSIKAFGGLSGKMSPKYMTNGPRISDSYVKGKIELEQTRPEYHGGLAGFIESGRDIENSYYAAKISDMQDSANSGIISGQGTDNLEHGVRNLYAKQETPLSNKAGRAKILEKKEMTGKKARRNMKFDFDKTWKTTDSYPELRLERYFPKPEARLGKTDEEIPTYKELKVDTKIEKDGKYILRAEGAGVSRKKQVDSETGLTLTPTKTGELELVLKAPEKSWPTLNQDKIIDQKEIKAKRYEPQTTLSWNEATEIQREEIINLVNNEGELEKTILAVNSYQTRKSHPKAAGISFNKGKTGEYYLNLATGDTIDNIRVCSANKDRQDNGKIGKIAYGKEGELDRVCNQESGDGTEYETGEKIEIEAPETASIGEKITLNLHVPDKKQEDYQVEIRNPEKSRQVNRVLSKNTAEINFKPDNKGIYTVKIYPTGTVQKVISILTNPLAKAKIKVKKESDQIYWKKYCQERNYNTAEIGRSINCLKNEVVPKCFKEKPGKKCIKKGENTVARSTCQNLLDYSYNPETQKCAP